MQRLAVAYCGRDAGERHQRRRSHNWPGMSMVHHMARRKDSPCGWWAARAVMGWSTRAQTAHQAPSSTLCRTLPPGPRFRLGSTDPWCRDKDRRELWRDSMACQLCQAQPVGWCSSAKASAAHAQDAACSGRIAASYSAGRRRTVLGYLDLAGRGGHLRSASLRSGMAALQKPPLL